MAFISRDKLEKLRIIIVRRDERGFAAAAHLFAMIPFWGFLFLLGLYFHFRERSREVVFHVQQALMFMGLSLALLIFYYLCRIFIKISAFLNEDLSVALENISDGVFTLVLVVYLVICFVGTLLVYLGKPFIYPIVGKQVLRTYTKKRDSIVM